MKLVSLGSLVGVSALGIVLGAVACTTSDDGDGDNANTGGAAATGGNAGTGGDGLGGANGDVDAVACPAPTEALVTNFAYDADTATSTSASTFGDFTDTFSGGTFSYGDGLTSDVTGSNWHLSGEVDSYSGFGLYLQDCSKFDASAFSGIQITISGDTDGRPVTLIVGTASNEIESAWLEANGATEVEPNFGRCTPADNQYDGTCGAPSFVFEVTDTSTPIQVSWSDLTGGSPEASVSPNEITSIAWTFAPPTGVDTAGVEPYPVDIVIEEISFIP